MNDDRNRIENRVRTLRKTRGLTQQDLAALLGVSRQTVNAIENGRYDPSLPLAFDIARVFAARIEDVFRPVDAGTDCPCWDAIMLRIPAVIHGKGVCLRPHRPSDLPAFEAFVTDPEATRYMGFTAEQKTPDGAAAMMDAVIGSYATEEPVFSLTIADPDTDAYLGAAGAADSGNGTLEVFVTLLPEAQGRGHATDAMRALIDYLFGNFGIQRLNADTVEDNLPSIRLLEGLGFSCAGPVERAAAEGEFGHRDMAGLRYVMTRDRFDTLETTR